ncbi:GumC family protein [Rhodovulum visakhapatnamense]|uniref:Polysaccharide chain length determinant protein (PEP-CTERM system associated) n=1 Tax=Rhodovulum visakhapatnamense TaxID=364297 RepID=A0A4R8F855_9RHOB|nr:chain length-determining protein [Rhodovulum visakhapatnamense]TDX21579.1 polysaccharide chain length determinant protein (PEP-CTERM system associated) [Rhodovulum visakhapatnamense]
MTFDLTLYWRLLLRRLPVMAVLLIACSVAGVVAAFKLPETYATSARLLVEAAQIPDRMVTSTVQTDAEEQLDIIEQKLLTRANMIDIANRFNVFPNLREMEPDEVVSAMRSATRVHRSAGRDQATLMMISFSSESPQIAANVVNEYVTLVLEENSEFRKSRAENTLQFFDQEAQRLGQDLDRQSTAIATFKSENADALPEDQSYRLGRQNLLQERLSRLERDLKAGQDQRNDIVRIFEATGTVRPDGGAVRNMSPEEQRLAAAKAELDKARAIYSETSPRVTSLQAVVDRLEKTVAEQDPAGTAGENPTATSPEQALLDATLSQLDSRLKSLQDDISSTNAELADLQALIGKSASNGIQLAALERDYEITQTRYNAAVANLNEARMSERVEASAKGQRITVIENASVPQLPSGPSRKKVAALGVGAGIGLAGAYFVLLELINRTIRTPSELTGRFNITPLTTIPYLEPPQRPRRRRTRRGATAACVVLLAGFGMPLGGSGQDSSDHPGQGPDRPAGLYWIMHR